MLHNDYYYYLKKIFDLYGVYIILQWESCAQSLLQTIFIKVLTEIEVFHIYFGIRGTVHQVITK